MSVLENNKVRLRAVEPEDIEWFYLWENDTTVWHVSNTLVPFSKFTLKQYIENSHNDIFTDKQLRLIIENKELAIPVGTIDLFDFDPFHLRAGIGILIADSKQRNQGLAGITIDLILNYTKEILGLHQLYCNIAENNPASLKLFTSKGFQISGTKKDWLKQNNNWIAEHTLQYIF